MKIMSLAGGLIEMNLTGKNSKFRVAAFFTWKGQMCGVEHVFIFTGISRIGIYDLKTDEIKSWKR